MFTYFDAVNIDMTINSARIIILIRFVSFSTITSRFNSHSGIVLQYKRVFINVQYKRVFINVAFTYIKSVQTLVYIIMVIMFGLEIFGCN